MDAQQNDLVRQLALFKLAVKRNFQKNIDLEAMVNDVEYARRSLTEIEDLAETEEMLMMVLQLRQRLVPAPAPQAIAAKASATEEVATVRNYKFGARSW